MINKPSPTSVANLKAPPKASGGTTVFEHPADGWYHIEPKGEHPNTAGQVVQIIDDAACHSIVHLFNADAATGRLTHGREMLIDHEHFKHDAEKESIAYGWLQQLENRVDGIYGRIRWTATGQKAVDGGDYRFFSTEYDQAGLELLNDRRVRPIHLAGLTLTNDPNNKGARPITNRHRQGAGTHDPAGKTGHESFDISLTESPSGRNTVTGLNAVTNKINMKNIAIKLGLTAEAGEDAILAEMTRLQNRLTLLEPLSAENTTLKNRLTELEREQIETLLDAHGIGAGETGRRERLQPVLLNLKNRAERQAFLDECLPKTAPPIRQNRGETASAQVKLHNRDTRPPGGGNPTSGNATADETGKAAKIINRARELKKETPNLSHATAVIMAQREVESLI